MDVNIIQGQATLTNAADVYTGTCSLGISAYVDKGLYLLKIPATNTTTTPTINLNTLGAKTVFRADGSALLVGDMLINNFSLFMFVSADNGFRLLIGNLIVLGTGTSGKLNLTQGGTNTNLTPLVVGQILYADSVSSLERLSDIATGNALLTGGVGVAPFYGKVGLTTHISGVLAEANGGTNQSTYTQGDILYASAANTLSKLAKGTKNQLLATNSAATLPEWQENRKFVGLRVLDSETSQTVSATVGGDFEVPFGGVINNVFANVDTAGVTGVGTYDVKKNGSTIFSTKITIDSTEKTSRTAATPPVLSVTTFSKGDIFTVDVVTPLQTTPAKGLTIMLDLSLTDY